MIVKTVALIAQLVSAVMTGVRTIPERISVAFAVLAFILGFVEVGVGYAFWRRTRRTS
jgi:hypothetical protein